MVLNDPNHSGQDEMFARQRLANAENDLAICKHNPPFPPPKTNFGQALVTIADFTYTFAVDLDGRVLYTKGKLGGGGSAWHEVGRGSFTGSAASAPAATIVASASFLFMTIRDSNGQIWLNQAQLNPEGEDGWVGWLAI